MFVHIQHVFEIAARFARVSFWPQRHLGPPLSTPLSRSLSLSVCVFLSIAMFISISVNLSWKNIAHFVY